MRTSAILTWDICVFNMPYFCADFAVNLLFTKG